MKSPGCFLFTVSIILISLLLIGSINVYALEPPPPGMIDQMKADGTYDDALRFAEKLGNHKIKAANRGSVGVSSDPQTVAELINENFGKSIEDKSASALGSTSPRDFDWLSLDKNHDRVVDERDVLSLGFPEPKVTASLPTLGTSNVFCLIIDFSDYPAYFTKAEFEDKFFGAGYSGWWYRSLKYYYTQASYSQLTIDGDIYGWYTAAHPRTYYHPNDNTDYPEDDLRREQLIFEAIDAADAAGADFSEFDNDNDGVVDYFLVVWAGPHGNWATFWWGYQTSIYVLSGKTVDGVRFGTYSWQWERYYSFGGTPPADPRWDPKVTIHETGHALGLPDYYDYDGSQGPDGGVGSLDMMDGNWGDHNCFSKYALGWLTPTVAFTNLNDEQLSKSCSYGDPVIFMPGFDPVSPWSEYFMAQNRKKEGVDSTYPTSDLLIWHVDASINKQGYTLYDNSYAEHKLLRLMEADGLEEIESGGQADAGDYYSSGEELSPTSTPNSNKYDATNPGITCDDISAAGDNMTADFTMYTSNPPTVDITAPTGGTVDGDVSVTIDASDDNAVSKVQLIIDGYLVKEWTTEPYTGLSYTWNSIVDFNGSRSIVARAWDAENNVGSDSVTVTVDNDGVTSVNDDFESGLTKWRCESEPLWSQGTYTNWDTRTSPGTPTPLGSGLEAYVKPSTGTEWHIAYDALRSQRIDATAFTKPVHVKFFYRAGNRYNNSGALKLWATTDNGATWTELDSLALSNNWTTYTNVFDYAGETVYFRLRYTGEFKENDGTYKYSAHIDNFLIEQSPSNPPTLTWTNPTTDGATVSGNYTFTVNANDDGTVSKVYFYMGGSLKSTDTAAPWQYTRNTQTNDDNHPALEIMAYAQDNHDLTSDKETLTVVMKNARPFPASDDLETDSTEWSTNNDTPDPDWAYISTSGNSGTHCYAWTTATWGQWNWDQLRYSGETPTAGLRTIDLSTAAVSSPILKYYYKADFPTNGYCQVYFYNTWTGWTIIDRVSTDKANWYQSSVPMDDWIGYSGHIVFYVRNDTNTNGTGMWIDDISIDNAAPFIVNVNPNRGKVGDSIVITGSAFGSSKGSGEIRFNNGAGGYISQTSATNWSNTSITCNIPTGAKSHASEGVWVYQGSQESNKKPLTVILTPPNFTEVEENR